MISVAVFFFIVIGSSHNLLTQGPCAKNTVLPACLKIVYKSKNIGTPHSLDALMKTLIFHKDSGTHQYFLVCSYAVCVRTYYKYYRDVDELSLAYYIKLETLSTVRVPVTDKG